MPTGPCLRMCRSPNPWCAKGCNGLATVPKILLVALVSIWIPRAAEAVHHTHARLGEMSLATAELTKFRDDVEVACEVDAQLDPPKELLNKLRQCTHALEEYAEKTKQSLKRTKEANEKFGMEYSNVMSLLAKLKDVQSMKKAFSLDQTQKLLVNTKADTDRLGSGSTLSAVPGGVELAQAASGASTDAHT
mmetsp:Transcript_105689/g.309113  ORF Transcript_105689/g.309113 Transcript_105689/m.309113 type:complete len:191 (+) Transcript_105689:106-678(+)